jgi:hypothetical protein
MKATEEPQGDHMIALPFGQSLFVCWAMLGSLIREVIEISQTIDACKMRINIERNNHDSDMACYAVFERKLEIKLLTNLLYYCLNKLRNLTTWRGWNKNVGVAEFRYELCL